MLCFDFDVEYFIDYFVGWVCELVCWLNGEELFEDFNIYCCSGDLVCEFEVVVCGVVSVVCEFD